MFSHPCNDRVLTSVFPGPAVASVELGRFVLRDDVPANGETWTLARCFEQLRRERLVGVVSFSDPIPRTTAGGLVVFPGHVGIIYRAHNARFLGRSTRTTLRVLPDGTIFSARAASKVRQRDRGWEYAVAQLARHGAEAPAPGEELAAWLRRVLARLTRVLTHPGNFRYAWPLDPRVGRYMPDGLPYPKGPV